MWQGCQCRLRHGVATAETPPTTPQVDCFKIVFDVTMGQGGKVVNATGGAALLPEKYHHQCHRLIVSKFVVDTGQRTTTRWQRLIFYFSMWHPLSHVTSKHHQQTLSPTPPVDCFSIFLMKVNVTNCLLIKIQSIFRNFLNEFLNSIMSFFIDKCFK